MKANGAPKSRFVYPDKLYARTNNNITIDISYAPQILEAVEYIRTDAFIEKARKWFEEQNEWFDISGNRHCDMDSFEDFKKYMEGE